MYRKLIALTCGLLISVPSLADSITDLNPKPGQWSTVIAILDHNKNHYLLKTTVNDDSDACWTKLKEVASKVKQENGLIWTNPAKSVISYEKKAGYAEAEAKVLELRCVLEPFTPEYVKKL